MDVELRFAAAERGEYTESDKLSVSGFKLGTRIDFAKAPRHDLMGEFGRDIFQRVDDICPPSPSILSSILLPYSNRCCRLVVSVIVSSVP